VSVASLPGDAASQPLLSIPGMGSSTAHTLTAEIGDIQRFRDVGQLLAYGGASQGAELRHEGCQSGDEPDHG
jgi:hypothetical protein